MSNLPDRADGEINPDAARLPENMALVKMENDQIFSMAAARPRNHIKIREELLGQLEAYPSFAKSVVYCKPVGKDKNGHMQYARGLSVRAAEALAEAYGFCRVRSDVSVIDADTVKIEASFVDYQRGRIWQDSGILSKFYKGKDGRTVRHQEDRFYNLVVKAEVSRRIRECIIRSVPPGLRSELMEMAERKIDELLDDKTVEKIIGQFATKQVTLEMLENHVGRSMAAGWTRDDRANLLGVWNGIKDGEFQIDEIFGNWKRDKAAPDDGQKEAAAAVAGALITPKVAPEAPKKPETPAELSAALNAFWDAAPLPGASPATSAPASTKPIPGSTKIDPRIDNPPTTTAEKPEKLSVDEYLARAKAADAAKAAATPVPENGTAIPQRTPPETPTPASTTPEPEKRRPGRPRKQSAPEAAIGAGNAAPPSAPAGGDMFSSRPTWIDEAPEGILAMAKKNKAAQDQAAFDWFVYLKKTRRWQTPGAADKAYGKAKWKAKAKRRHLR